MVPNNNQILYIKRVVVNIQKLQQKFTLDIIMNKLPFLALTIQDRYR